MAFEFVAIMVFIVRRRRTWLIAILAMAGLAAIPLISIALPRLRSGPEASYRYVPLPTILQDLINAFSLGISVDFHQIFWLDLIFLVVFLIGIIATIRRPSTRSASLFILGYATIPILALYLGSFIKPMWLGVRHLIVISPAFYLGLATGLNTLRNRWWPLFAGCLLVFLGGIAYSTANVYYSPTYIKDDLRSLVRYLEQHTHPGDVILLRDPVISHVIDYYYQGQVPWQALPRYGDTVDAATYATLEQLTGEYNRIWNVYSPPGFFEDPQGLVKRWLDENLYRVENIAFEAYGTSVAASAYLTNPPYLEELPAGVTQVNARIGDELVLLGYDLPHGPPVAGKPTVVRLYWQVTRRPEEDYKLGLRLVDDAGQIWGEGDQYPFGGLHDTSDWKPGRIIRVDQELSITPGAPPGPYKLVLRTYRPDSGEVLSVTTAGGQPAGQNATLGLIEVEHNALAAAKIQLPHQDNAWWQTGIRLLGHEFVPAALRPGEMLAVSLYFKAEQIQQNDLHLRLELVDSTGRSRSTVEALPVGNNYPPTTWQSGDILMGQHQLIVPPDAEPGDYSLRVSLIEPDGQAVPVRHGWWPLNATSVTFPAVHVEPIQRSTSMPAMAHPLQAKLGDAVELLGYDGDAATAQRGDTINSTVYWRAISALADSYKVTVQLISNTGQIVGQQDSIPADWTRPTTGWMPGEVITDPHQVQVQSDAAPGRYNLVVALYDERTGQRLLVRQDGAESDHIVLTPVEIK
jgi:hypothetical protein